MKAFRSERPANVAFELTAEQVDRLKAHTECVNREAAAGRPGMLVAQIYMGDPPYAVVGFVPHEQARLLEHIDKQ